MRVFCLKINCFFFFVVFWSRVGKGLTGDNILSLNNKNKILILASIEP